MGSAGQQAEQRREKNPKTDEKDETSPPAGEVFIIRLPGQLQTTGNSEGEALEAESSQPVSRDLHHKCSDAACRHVIASTARCAAISPGLAAYEGVVAPVVERPFRNDELHFRYVWPRAPARRQRPIPV